MHPLPPPAWGEGGLKILEKSLLGGGQKFLFWYVWEGYIVGGGGHVMLK